MMPGLSPAPCASPGSRLRVEPCLKGDCAVREKEKRCPSNDPSGPPPSNIPVSRSDLNSAGPLEMEGTMPNRKTISAGRPELTAEGDGVSATADVNGASVVLADKGYCGTSGATASAGTGVWYVEPEADAREAAITSREAM